LKFYGKNYMEIHTSDRKFVLHAVIKGRSC